MSDALKKVRELQRLLGKKAIENEALKEAVELVKSQKWLAYLPLLSRYKPWNRSRQSSV
jgi:transposase